MAQFFIGRPIFAWVVAIFVMLGGVMWLAPVAAYFLLLSVWARKLVILWAVVPLISLPLAPPTR